MTSEERLERRLQRERSARRETEIIAELRLTQLSAERNDLQEVVETQTTELQKALELIEMTRVEISHDVLWGTAEKLNKASFSEFSEGIYSALAALGVGSEAHSTSLWEIDLDTCIASPSNRWVAEGPLHPLVSRLVSHRIKAELLDGIANFDVGSCLAFGPSDIDEMLPDLKNSVGNPWSEHSQASLNIGLLGYQDQKVTVLTVFSQNQSDRPSYLTYLLRGTMLLLRQFISRIEVELQLSTVHEKQSQIHRSFMKSADKLMTASQQNLDETFSEVVRDTAILLNSPEISDWTVDYENQQYVLGGLWRHTSFVHRQVGETADFGTRPLLDASRTEATTIEINPEIPTLAEPSRIAVVRGDALRPSGIIIAARLEPVRWQPFEIEVLERLSTFMFAVEGRLSSDSRANAVLHSSPLPIVLRRSGDHALLNCNSAFLKLIGRSSVDEVLGTPPSAILYEKVEDVEEKFQSSAFWMFEEASRGATGELPSIAVYRGPEGRPILAEIRCTEVLPAHADSFILGHVSDITEQRMAHKKIQLHAEHLAFAAAHDDLTGLFNRRGVLARISEFQEEFSHGALLLIDLDRFKNVNDSLGHATGNILLQRVAHRLEKNVRPDGVVGRLSGDEFVVVLPGPISKSEVAEIGNLLIEKVGAASVVRGHRLYPSLSIGIAFWNDVVEASEALLHADTAMYKAKKAGGRRLMIFDKSLQEEIETKQELEAELRQALEQDEFCVHYQPVVSLLTGEIVGAEALVRWQHPRRGLLAAGTFIEAAEEMGLVADIGRLVLERACIDAAAWPQGSKPTSLSVNIAASQIADGHSLSKEVVRVLMESGFEASRLCLEVTESALIRDLELAVSILDELAVKGVRFSLDDFGTGYSSLAYLKHLKVDSLKIDKSFLTDLRTDPDSVKFVNSILGLADTLKLGVVAEGVETQEQAEMLRSLGCEKAQGWFYYKALPNHEIQELLRAQAAVL